MFSSKNGKVKLNSLIGPSIKIQGNLICSEGLRIDGEVQGNIHLADNCTGTLVISENARIEGEVRAPHMVISGTVIGPVYCTNRLELQPTCRISGDIEYQTMEVQWGAHVDGRLINKNQSTSVVKELKVATPRLIEGK